MSDLFLCIGLLGVSISQLSLILVILKMTRKVDEVLVFVDAFLSSIRRVPGSIQDLEGGDQDA